MYNNLFKGYIATKLPQEIDFDGTLSEIFNDMLKTEATILPEKVQQKKKPNNLEIVNSVVSKYDTARISDKAFDFEAIKLNLEGIRGHSITTVAYTSDDKVHVPILNVSKASTFELSFLLDLFTADIPDSATKIADQLLQFIPVIEVQAPPKKKNGGHKCEICFYARSCSWCSQEFCQHHPLKTCHFPRTGLASSDFCSQCIEDLSYEDANNWAEASLTSPNLESIVASLGCAFIAIALGYDSQRLLWKIAKKLQSFGKHAAAYSVLDMRAVGMASKR